MGFWEEFKAFDNVVFEKSLEKAKTMFKNATDENLIAWWNEKQYDDTVHQRVKDLAEDELRRRYLL